jgi:hypothetical protein
VVEIVVLIVPKQKKQEKFSGKGILGCQFQPSKWLKPYREVGIQTDRRFLISSHPSFGALQRMENAIF